MSNYAKTTNQDVENMDGEKLFENVKNENRELFKRALSEAVDSKISIIEEKNKDTEIPHPSKRHKIRMNRIFREHVRGHFLPFPEADNIYERIRSTLIVKLKINQFIGRREERGRKK